MLSRRIQKDCCCTVSHSKSAMSFEPVIKHLIFSACSTTCNAGPRDTSYGKFCVCPALSSFHLAFAAVQDRQIAQVSAAKRHTVALTHSGDVFTWGHRQVNPRRVTLPGTPFNCNTCIS